MSVPAFLVCAHAIVRKPNTRLQAGLVFGFFLIAFLSTSHRPLTRAAALSLAFAMTVFRSLTFRSCSILIWHHIHLLPVGER
ncbi:MAG: hypothetical protein EA399_14715 [Desulfovibrionales bacterium]|nr:MAG: hypothetical protein EA399_14715 [Desulfovibrionales bacterium]